MKNQLLESTKRYGRTTREVFKDERAEWFEPPPKYAKVDRAVMFAAALAFVFLVAGFVLEKFV